MIQNIKCQFCEKKTGEFDLPEGITFQDTGVVDIRCDTCEIKYGNYKEMAEKFEKETGLPHDEFKTMITQAGGKKADFDLLLKAKKAELEAAKIIET